MTSDDLATLRAILAAAKPDAIIEALPVRVLRVLMAGYEMAAELTAEIAALQAHIKALGASVQDGMAGRGA